MPQNEKQSPFPKKRRVDNFEAKFLNVQQVGLQKSRPKESTAISDSDEMFLLSQMFLIKNMSPANKMDLQMKYLQLVHSYSANNVTANELNFSINFLPNEDEDSVISLYLL